jgi:Flp pilus assembly pilin Flp
MRASDSVGSSGAPRWSRRRERNAAREVLSYPHVLAIPLRIERRHHRQDMRETIRQLLIGACRETEGQDVAEYAIMLAVILVIVVGTVRMIGSNAGVVFSQVASGIQ